MKRIVFVLGITASFAVMGCLKEDKVEPCVVKTLEQDKVIMTKFAADSSITATEDPTGLFYQIIEPGTGATPTATSTVTVRYVGRFTDNGQRVDASNLDKDVSFPLDGVIRGWTIGIPKIKAGGKIKMIIPSSLGYGCSQGTRTNQPLYFYVELLSVK
jgi:FKBP-type peptidyl-prolyl cis-trans isomerase